MLFVIISLTVNSMEVFSSFIIVLLIQKWFRMNKMKTYYITYSSRNKSHWLKIILYLLQFVGKWTREYFSCLHTSNDNGIKLIRNWTR